MCPVACFTRMFHPHSLLLLQHVKNRTVQNVIRTSQEATTIDLSFELSIGQTIAILEIFDFYNQLRTKVTTSVSISMYAVVQPSTPYSSTRNQFVRILVDWSEITNLFVNNSCKSDICEQKWSHGLVYNQFAMSMNVVDTLKLHHKFLLRIQIDV